ncbi:histidine kinase [Flavobacterium sp.]|uniref:Hpt domain-containing protein n=1 Tax=Flavobacterium sp. TaxID=239 RepID=UPI0026101D02|nr:histidine kinase [Flavobacterium sp.]MDD3004415.1 histidine kinase [Flavobacterium sp.]
MALHYNLEKVHAISENDTDFVLSILKVFIQDIPLDFFQMKEAIKNKEHQNAYSFAHKIKPSLDLLGMTIAYDEAICIENWSRQKGKKKEIKDTYKSLEHHLEKAIKEIKKDYNLL